MNLGTDRILCTEWASVKMGSMDSDPVRAIQWSWAD